MNLLYPVRSHAQGDQTKITVKLNAYSTTGAWLHLPDDYNSTSQSYPLIIFLHGVGEGGTDLNVVLANGLPKIIAQGAKMQFTVGGKLFKFITVCPQIPSGWASEGMVQSILDDVKAKYRVDASRVYLTGLSAGGYGTLTYAASGTAYSNNIAAIVPASTAAFDKASGLCAMGQNGVASLFLCGDADGFIDNQKRYVAAINACNPTYPAIATSYPGGTHSGNVWDKVYDVGHTYQNPNIYEWMLQYSRGSQSVIPAPVANVTPASTAITLPTSSVTLDGSSSTAQNSTIASYAWSLQSGPSTPAYSSTSAAKITVSNLVAGTYIFNLTVKNAAGATSTKQATVTVTAAATPVPVVSITSNNVTLPTNSTTLDGSASTTPNSSITSYTWALASGPSTPAFSSLSTAKVIISNLIAGSYTFNLTVKNAAGGSTTKQATVVVSPAAGTGGGGGNGNEGATPPPVACAGCKYLVKPGTDGGAYINATGLGLKAGDTVCVQGGNYKYMQFMNFTGTTAKPFVFINCGGQVKIGNGGSYGLIFNNCKYFKVTGSGSSDKYGFSVNGVSTRLNVGLAMGKGCTDYEADRIEITGSEVGVMAKVNPDCETANQYPYFAIRNVKLHDLYIHDVSGEGMYVGNTAPNGTEVVCDGVTKNVLPPRIYGLRIYNVITNNTGWDGIQVASAPTDVEIYANKVSNYGTTNFGSQQAGILLGGETNGKVYNNVVNKGTGNGIQILGIGFIQVYNNVVVDAGWDGSTQRQDAIFIDDRPTKNDYVPPYVHVYNNTVVNSGRDGIRQQNSFGSFATGNQYYNNLIVSPGSLSSRGVLGYLSIQSGIQNLLSNNLNFATTAEVKFVDAANRNYHLAAGSPAIDKGKDLSSVFRIDLDNLVRPQGAGFDVGAYEFGTGGTTPPNVSPEASAGNDITITLPVASVTLDASGSGDPDGTIASYAWTQVSGPVTATFSSAAVAKPVVTKLTTAGTYVFKLTIKDNDGATATDQVTVTVKAGTGNQSPVANAGTNISITLPTSTATLNGSASKDADGTIASYAWAQVSGPSTASIASAASVNANVSKLTVAGTYVFSLTIKDNLGATGTDQVSVTVMAASSTNQAPVANAGSNVTITLPTTATTLSGAASKDPDGSVTAYGWSQVSGPVSAALSAATSSTVSISKLTVAGTYVFNLTVKDNDGATDNATATVTVKAAPATNTPPVANAGADQTFAQPRNSSDANAAASKDGDGRIVSYLWSQVSGPVSASIVSPTSAKTDFNRLTSVGVYVFRLTVTDEDGATDTDDITITVTPNPANQLIANAGADQSVNYPSANTATLDASASYATNGGYISRYAWTVVSGPSGGASILNTAAMKPVVSFAAAGTYVLRLTVTDTYGNKVSDDVTVVVGGAGSKMSAAMTATNAEIAIYPNPVASNLRLTLTMSNPAPIVVRLYNSNGQLKATWNLGTVSSVQRDFDVSSLTAGMYILQVSDGQQMNLSNKFIKN